ncbi:MAG TPA: transcription termination factor Rho [Planctomycetota bacterium]|nr:transcription termination factor Rho [Planctomycetota bacterium]
MTSPPAPQPEVERDPAVEPAAREATHAPPSWSVDDLQALPMPELVALAEQEGLDGVIGLNRQELLFELLKHRAHRAGAAFGAGVLDVLPDGFGFLRSRRHGYRSGPDDIYVSPSQVRRLNLKRGHFVGGPVRPPRDGERYFALLHVDTVNGASIADLRRRVPFESRTPIVPRVRLRLEHPGCSPALRAIELLAPFGRGQRVLVQAPPQCGRTKLLTEIALGIAHNKDVHVIVLLLDERPEEVTAVERKLAGVPHAEVVASTFDEPPGRQLDLAELVLDRARRMVEAEQDVALVVDSLTALARACNTELPHSGKVLCAGFDATSLLLPKRLFGAARQCEEGGSLTVVGAVLTETGSHADALVAAELRGKGNCDLVLDRRQAELHVFPAFDVARTGTRREDEVVGPEEAAHLRALRARLLAEPEERRLSLLLEGIARTADNAELLHGGL